MTVYHVVPVNDVIAHEEDEDNCVCGPETEFAAGSRIIIHHELSQERGGRTIQLNWPPTASGSPPRWVLWIGRRQRRS